MVWNNSKLSDALQLRDDDEKFSAQTTLLNLTKTSVLSRTEDFLVLYLKIKRSDKLLRLFGKEGNKKKKGSSLGVFRKRCSEEK